jgi:hypothetical protein
MVQGLILTGAIRALCHFCHVQIRDQFMELKLHHSIYISPYSIAKEFALCVPKECVDAGVIECKCCQCGDGL